MYINVNQINLSQKASDETKLKTALIVGASGLVGQQLLARLLAHQKYSRVIALVRVPLDIEKLNLNAEQAAKLEQHQVDFNQLSLNEMVADDIFCTLGTTIKKAGSKRAFYQVDYTYPLEIAKQCKVNGASVFAVVTAMGSSSTSKIFYNKVKGDIEQALIALNFEHLGIFRPSMLAGERNEFRLGEYIGSIIMKAFTFILPNDYRVINASSVAQSMINYAIAPTKNVNITLSGQMQNR